MTNSNTEKLLVEIARAKDYREVAATGVYGGPATNGTVHACFYVEALKTPSVVRVEVADGRLVQTDLAADSSDNVRTLLRELQVGLVLSPRDAASIGHWLIERAREILDASQEMKGTL